MRQKEQNPNLDREWFSQRMAERELTVRGLAKQLGTSPSTVSLMLRGVSKIPEGFLPQLSDLFGVDSIEILKRAGAPLTDQKRTLTVTHYMNEQRDIVQMPQGQEFTTASPFDTRASGFGVQIRVPGIYERWLIYAGGQRLTAAQAVGTLCVYENMQGQIYVAVIKNGFVPGQYDAVSAFNDGTVVNDIKIKWATPVTWIKPATAT